MKEISLPLYTLLFFLVLTTVGHAADLSKEQVSSHLKNAAEAQFRLSYIYNRGNVVGETDEENRIIKSEELKILANYLLFTEKSGALAQYQSLSDYYNSISLVIDNKNEILSLTKFAAEKGDPYAQYRLGDHHLRDGYAKYDYLYPFSYDELEAGKWYTLAFESYRRLAEKGDIDAQYKLWEMSNDPLMILTSISKKEREKWSAFDPAVVYHSLAEKGDADAQHKIARIHGLKLEHEYRRHGRRTIYENKKIYDPDPKFQLDMKEARKLYKIAFESYRRLAQKGDIDAQYKLGRIYDTYDYKEISDKYIGIERDEKKAKKWYALALAGYRRLAEKGDVDAQYKLGIMANNNHGYNNFQQSRKEAIKWLKLVYIHYLLLYPELSYAEDLYALGDEYRYNIYKDGIDNKKALKLFTIAAKRGHANAQKELGNIYYNGEIIKKNYKEAVKWYNMAAKQNIVWAQYRLGNIYYQGLGVKQNYKEAMKWYTLAAKQRSTRAQLKLGVMYSNGHGVSKDLIRSSMWLSFSGENDFNVFKFARDEDFLAIKELLENNLKKEMSPQQIGQAEQLTKTCRKNNFEKC